MQTQSVIRHIADWLANYNQQAKTKGFVVGISGGIDSAVTSTLGAESGLPVLCVEMPIHQAQSQVSRAHDHIEWLKKRYPNVQSVEVALTDVFDRFVKAMPPEQSPNTDLSLVNARARLRMTALYYLAGVHHTLVLGTGNKIEDFGIGFFTKYGDGGVDLSPIADLTKSEVYAVGKSLGIVDSIMTAPPTDGLWGDDRTDEDQIGATYPELEWAMDFSGNEKELSERQREVLSIFRKFHAANHHKMVSIPVCQIPDSLR